MSKKILLADDSVTIRKIVELTFGDSDYRVESVGSGVEALERFESMRPDLVVADVTMPGPNGYDVCRSIKLSAHPVPVLLLAGTFERYDEQAAEHCAADAYLTKPFDTESLVRLVDLLISTPPARIEPAPGDASSEVVTEPTVATPEAEIVVDAEGGGDRLDPLEEMQATTVDDGRSESVEGLPEADVEPDAASESAELQPSDVSALAREVVRLLSDEVVRDIARQIVPEVAERVVRERIRELEADES